MDCYPWHPVGGRQIPTDPIIVEEAMIFLGILERSYYFFGMTKICIKVAELRGSLKLDKPSSEAIRRQFLLYFLGAYFLGDNKTFIPLHLVSLVRDMSILKDIDWGSLTFSYHNWGLCRYAS